MKFESADWRRNRTGGMSSRAGEGTGSHMSADWTVHGTTRGEDVGADASRAAAVGAPACVVFCDSSPLLEAPSLPRLQTVECRKAHRLASPPTLIREVHLPESHDFKYAAHFQPFLSCPNLSSNYRLVPYCPTPVLPDACA